MSKKNMKILAIAFVIFYLLTQPANAANLVNTAFAQIGDAGDALAQFVNRLGTSS